MSESALLRKIFKLWVKEIDRNASIGLALSILPFDIVGENVSMASKTLVERVKKNNIFAHYIDPPDDTIGCLLLYFSLYTYF